MKQGFRFWFLGATASLFVTAPAWADITGTIDASITLTAGCIINTQNHDNGAGSADFGSLDFGSHNTLFTQADALVMNGGNAFEVQCSPGIAPSLKFGVGDNDGRGAGSGLRAMAHEVAPGNTKYVTYNLYSDSARNNIISIGGSVALDSDGEAQTVDIYARAFGEDGLVIGTYTDVITVTLEL